VASEAGRLPDRTTDVTGAGRRATAHESPGELRRGQRHARLARGAAAVMLVAVTLTLSSAAGRTLPTQLRYISREQIDALPSPWTSFYVQPWRGYLETVPATQFLDGIGINYNLVDHGRHDANIRALAAAGFRSLRVEVPWGRLDDTESGVAARFLPDYQGIFAACHRYGITPLVLLNANSGGPEPSRTTDRTVAAAAPAGARALRLTSVEGLVVGHSGLSNLTGSWMAEVLFTAVDHATDTVTLSRPLPVPLRTGMVVPVDTLRHLPLYPVGTPEFDDTATAWVHYADVVSRLVEAAGITHYDVEIWNELTFGEEFLSIDSYYDPPLVSFPTDFFRPGGQAWELADRTTRMLKAEHPGSRVIWGFSNTSFLHTPPAELPPMTDGQSYHPYATAPLVIPSQLPAPRDRRFLVGYLPSGLTLGMPESSYALAVRPEQLIRGLLEPRVRAADRPPQSPVFFHYMTEHGFDPAEAGITDPAQAQSYKARGLLRALCFWLDKGITRMDIFTASSPTDTGYGMFGAGPDPVASQPLTALRRLVGAFAGAQPLVDPRQLGVSVTAEGTQEEVFAGDATHPPLWYRDLFAVLPYQVDAHRFVVPVYVMSYDLAKRLPAMDFDVTLRNLDGRRAAVSYYDPITDQHLPIPVLHRDATSVEVAVSAADYPRLLVVGGA
jgi:hypothetical protein